MPRHVWLCGMCGAEKGTEDEAIICEQDHLNRVERAVVKGFGWKKKSWENNAEGLFPKTVTIQFSEARGDFAIYERKQIGFRGV